MLAAMSEAKVETTDKCQATLTRAFQPGSAHKELCTKHASGGGGGSGGKGEGEGGGMHPQAFLVSGQTMAPSCSSSSSTAVPAKMPQFPASSSTGATFNSTYNSHWDECELVSADPADNLASCGGSLGEAAARANLKIAGSRRTSAAPLA